LQPEAEVQNIKRNVITTIQVNTYMYNVITRNIKQGMQKPNMGYYSIIIDVLKAELEIKVG